MRISARNQLRGVVKTLQKGAVNSDVILDLGDGLEIFANITNEAVTDLRLATGRPASTLRWRPKPGQGPRRRRERAKRQEPERGSC